MLHSMGLLAQMPNITINGKWSEMCAGEAHSIIFLIVGVWAFWIGLFIGVPLLLLWVWRFRVRGRGYPGLRAYLRELPHTEEQKLGSVDLALKGGVLCVLGLLFLPLLLFGLVPLYYGIRKLAAVGLGISGTENRRHEDPRGNEFLS